MDDDAVLAEAGAAARAEHWLSHMMKASVSDDTITYNTVIKAETGKEREGERQGRREREGGERERDSKRAKERGGEQEQQREKGAKGARQVLIHSLTPDRPPLAATTGNYWNYQ